MSFFDLESMASKQLAEGVSLKAVHGEKIMLSFVEAEAGSVVPHHQHEHEQMGYVISGEFELTIGDESKICRPGDTYLAPSNVPHSVKVSDKGPIKVLDIFSPPREEYK